MNKEIIYVIKEKEYTAKIPEEALSHFIDGLVKCDGKIKSDK